MHVPSPRATHVLAQLTELATRSPARATVDRLLRDPTPPAHLRDFALPLADLEDQLRLASLGEAQLAELRTARLGAPQLEEILRTHRAALHAERVLAAARAPASVGLSDAQFAALLDGSCPLPFASPAAFLALVGQLGEALGESLGGELPTGSVRLIGTSATLFSLNPRKPPDRRFDGEPGRCSDLDLGLESPPVSRWLRERGASVGWSRINAGGTIGRDEVIARLPAVGDWLARWSASLGRSIGLVASGDGGPRRWPSPLDVVAPLTPGMLAPAIEYP